MVYHLVDLHEEMYENEKKNGQGRSILWAHLELEYCISLVYTRFACKGCGCGLEPVSVATPKEPDPTRPEK